MNVVGTIETTIVSHGCVGLYRLKVRTFNNNNNNINFIETRLQGTIGE